MSKCVLCLAEAKKPAGPRRRAEDQRSTGDSSRSTERTRTMTTIHCNLGEVTHHLRGGRVRKFCPSGKTTSVPPGQKMRFAAELEASRCLIVTGCATVKVISGMPPARSFER